MKKVMPISCVLLLLSVLAGCSAKTDSAETEKPPVEEIDTQQEEMVMPVPEETEKDASENTDLPMVGIVTYSGGIEDGSFNQSAWEGLLRLSGSVDCDIRFLESSADGDFRENLHSLIDGGSDLCWGIGYNCADSMLAEAEEHPDISFAIVDYAYPDTPDNMTGVTFRAEESSFLAGYIAGCVTQTGRIGFVGGEANEVISQFQYGYQAGAAYAMREKDRTVEVETEYANDFSDPEMGKTIALELYDRGCDIVFHAAGETGMGVIEAARETGRYVIGVDKDQAFLAPELMLTSVLKDVNAAVFRVSGEFLGGADIGGRTISLGLAENAVGISEEHGLYPDDVYEETLRLRDRIIAGELVPPASQEAYQAFLETQGSGL